jgi:DNA-directed RNA polymerase beta subunit
MPRGGARPNSGPKKGTRYKGTISKEQAREALRQIVIREMDALVSAQVSNAKGIKYLVVREKKTGKFLRVSELRARGLKPDEEIVEIWEKDPSVQAFTDLLNRTIDKPAEHVELTGKDGEPLEVKWLS